MQEMLVKIYACCLLYWAFAVHAAGFTIMAEGGPATERTTDLPLRCDVADLPPEDELLRVTWSSYDQRLQTYVEIFSADLTPDAPAYYFADSWTGRGVYDPTIIGNIVLPAKFVTKQLIGEYRCQVNSLLSSGVANVKVDVFYGPGTSIMTTPGGRVEQREGDSLTLTCMAQCNPSCAYRWYKAGKKISDESVLEMSSLSSADAGLYACQARNDAGRSIKPVDLRVFYHASVKSFNISGLVDDDVNSGFQKLVDPPGNVVASCDVHGWPEATVDLLKDGLSSWSANSTADVQRDLDRKLSKYELKSPTCLDNGEYTCRASNGIGSSATKSAALNLACAPFETNQSSKCLPGPTVDLVVNLNEYAEFYLCFYGHPEPVVNLVAETGVAQDENVYNLKTYCDKSEKRCEAKLQLNITSPRQYGVYQAQMSNFQGYLYKKYNIASQQPPVAPTFFRIANSTRSSVCFFWDTQFNGGSKQTYSLSYRLRPIEDVPHEADEKYSVTMIDEHETGNLKTYSACVNNLLSSAEYEATLTPTNKYGRSKYTKSLVFILPTVDEGASQPWILNQGDSPSSNQENAELILKPDRSQPQRTLPNPGGTPKGFSHPRHWHKGFFDQHDEQEGEPQDDRDVVDEDGFLQLFDSFFVMDSLTDINSSPKPKSFSNFSAHLRKLVNTFTRAHQNGSRHSSLNKLSLPSNSQNLSNKELTTASISNSLAEDAQVKTNFILSLVVSASSVAVFFILGAVVILTCKRVVKKRRRLKECQKRHIKRLKLSRDAIGGIEVIVNDFQPSPSPRIASESNADVEMMSPPSPASNDVNDSETLHPSASLRPRLATPNMSTSRQKLTSSLTETGIDSYSVTDDHGPDSERASCPSYLDLYASASNIKSREHREAAGGLTTHECLDMISLSRVNTITPPVSRYPSTLSVDQTSVKQLSDADDNAKYLDLYEALATRSRSRSPSNAYDPLHFDIVQIETMSHASGPSLSVRATPPENFPKARAMIGQRLLRHARMTQPMREPPRPAKRSSTHVRSVVKCLEQSMSVPQKAGISVGAERVNLQAELKNLAELPNSTNPRKSVSDGYLKPRDFSYANAQTVAKSTSLNTDTVSDFQINTMLKDSSGPVPRKRNYANMGKPRSLAQRSGESVDEVYSVDRLMVVNGASAGKGVALYEEGVLFTRDSYYVDIDTCIHCRPYVDMKATLLSRGQGRSPFENSTGAKFPKQISNLKSTAIVRPLSSGYLNPLTVHADKTTNSKKLNKSASKALAFDLPKHSAPSTSRVQPITTTTSSSGGSSPGDAGRVKSKKTNNVQAYMVTDCVNIDFPDDCFMFSQENNSHPDMSNIYDEVVAPIPK